MGQVHHNPPALVKFEHNLKEDKLWLVNLPPPLNVPPPPFRTKGLIAGLIHGLTETNGFS